MTHYRALAVVIAAALVTAAVTAALFSSDVEQITTGDDPVVGSRELVRITSEDGITVEAPATVDTGAERSAIGLDLAEELGLDIDGADTVVVRSALGEEERPVAPVAVQLAGASRGVTVSMNDRSELTDPVLVGRDLLDGILVSTSQTNLTTPGSATAPSALQSLLAAQSSAIQPGPLLAMLPVAALAVVVLRYLVGVSTLGTFTPVLLTLAFLQTGLLPAFVLTMGVIALGVASEPLMRRWRTPRVARLAVLISMAALLMLAINHLLGLEGAADSWGAAFPLVVAAGLVERLYETWTLDGAIDALTDTGWTVVVAAGVTPLLLAPPVRLLAEGAPWALATGALLLSLVVGSYRGLRINELLRFARTAEEGST